MIKTHEKRRGAKGILLMAITIIALFLNTGELFAKSSPANSIEFTDAQQQKEQIKGTVVDEKGEAIIGANVAQKGTSNGTMTDMDGKFSISVNAGTPLTFSYVGCIAQTVPAAKGMKVILKENSRELSEIVVVGYGTQKKGNLTGAVANVDVSKTLSSRPIADVGRALQGTTPGLSIRVPDAEIGSDPTIRIRGQYASSQGGSSPLILLDNVEIPSISIINPDDIESITVLKDAASASIYGAKAAFGVILITSKKGAKIESTNVSYTNNFAWQSTEKGYNMGGLDAMEYILQADANSNTAASGAFYKITPDGVAKAREWAKTYGGKIGPNDPTVYGRDWYVDANGYKIGLRTYDAYDYMVKKSTPSQTHNLTVNGKSGNTVYNIGLGYLDQGGMNKTAKDDSFQRYNASLKVSTQLNKFITLNGGMMYSKKVKNYPYTTQSSLDQWYYVYRWGSQYPMGSDENGNELRSPASEYGQANTSKLESNYANINLGIHLDLTKDWTADFDYTHANEETNWLRPGIRFTAADTWSSAVPRIDSNGKPVFVNNAGQVVEATATGAIKAYDLRNWTYTAIGSTPDHINQRYTNSQRNVFNAYTTYQLNLNELNKFKFMMGINRVAYDRQWVQAQVANLLNYENVQFASAAGDKTISALKDWDSQLGFFGRINYNFNEKYLLEANLRYDGTSKFPDHLKWRWFPSFSGGWRASEETFMEWAKPTLSTLKVRGSYGVIGDQSVPNSLYIPLLGQITQSGWLDETGNKLNTLYSPTAVLKDITWQDIATLDFGLDARFFNNDLGVTFDWYKRDTKNMIVPKEGVAPVYGTIAPYGNFGNLSTKGWEISLDYNHQFKNGLKINAMVTLSDAITKVTDYGSATNIDGWYTGKTLGEIWGYRTDRLYQKEDFMYDTNGKLIPIVLTEANGKANAGKTVYKQKGDKPLYQGYLQSGSFKYQPGDVKFKDVNGDGQITDEARSVSQHGDLEVIGNSAPRYEYGVRLGAEYKGVDISIFFQGVGKRDLWGSSATTLPGFNTADGAIASRFCSDYWTESNPNAFYPRPWNMANDVNSFNMYRQDRYLLDMSYLRVKNVSMGYTLPATFTRKAWIQKARIYVSMENLLTFDHLDGTPVDPEIIPGIGSSGLLSSDNYQNGRAGMSSPAFKSISFGVQLNF